MPHLTLAPQGLHREGQSAGRGNRRVTKWGAAPRHRRPLPTTGFPQTTLAVLFVTYCGVQLVKERERTLALEEEQKQGKLKPE